MNITYREIEDGYIERITTDEKFHESFVAIRGNIKTIYINGDEITETKPILDNKGKDTGKTEVLATGEFEQIPVKVNAYQDLLDRESLPESDPKKITIDRAIDPDQIYLDLLGTERQWVMDQFKISDVEIKRHHRNDPRKIGDIQGWYNFENKLCDYIKSGKIIGDRPVAPQ